MIVIQITDVAKVRLVLEVSDSKTFQEVVIQHTTVDLLITGIKIGPDIYPNGICMYVRITYKHYEGLEMDFNLLKALFDT